MKVVAVVALAFTLVLSGCGNTSSDFHSPIDPPDDSTRPPDVGIPEPPYNPDPYDCGAGLAARDLAGKCRFSPTTPGALEAVS